MRHRNVALGNREVARQSRLGGEEVVAVIVDPLGGKVVSDEKGPRFGVEQEREVHALGDPFGGCCALQQPVSQRLARGGPGLDGLGQRPAPIVEKAGRLQKRSCLLRRGGQFGERNVGRQELRDPAREIALFLWRLVEQRQPRA